MYVTRAYTRVSQLYIHIKRKNMQVHSGLLLAYPTTGVISNPGQESLHPSGKGRDGFLFPLICTIEIPHEQIK